MSFDGGPPMPQTPGGGMYRPAPFPPPTPIAHQQQYDHGHTPYPTAHTPISDYNISYSSNNPKRKATRASQVCRPPRARFGAVYSEAKVSQACDSCRQLKAKCDETKPCKSCKEKGFECKYRDPIPKQ